MDIDIPRSKVGARSTGKVPVKYGSWPKAKFRVNRMVIKHVDSIAQGMAQEQRLECFVVVTGDGL